VFAGSPEAILLADPDTGVILDANPAAERLLGRPWAALVGLHQSALHAPAAADSSRRLFREQAAVLASGGSVPPVETVVVRADGTVVPVEILGSVFAIGRRKVMQGVFRDLTARKRAAAEICRLNGELERRIQARTAELAAANQELESFAYSVSHDLRAPLRGIAGWCQALAEDCGGRLDDAGREHLACLRAEILRMSQLIAALLDLSRVMRGGELRRERLDLSQLAREVVAGIRRHEPERRAEFRIADGLAAEGDPALVRNLLANLLGNAWKFTAKRACARIEVGGVAGAEGAPPVFFVRDNGAGFDMAYAHKLFRPFQRLHSATDYEGTGVGLATVWRIVARHGGRIWAEGEVGRGATFHFTLAAAPAGPSSVHE
jgi:PAS domain S-box-containing protein